MLDVEHSGAEREMVAELAGDAEGEVLEAARAALDAWWRFLTAVDEPAPADAAAKEPAPGPIRPPGSSFSTRRGR